MLMSDFKFVYNQMYSKHLLLFSYFVDWYQYVYTYTDLFSDNL